MQLFKKKIPQKPSKHQRLCNKANTFNTLTVILKQKNKINQCNVNYDYTPQPKKKIIKIILNQFKFRHNLTTFTRSWKQQSGIVGLLEETVSPGRQRPALSPILCHLSHLPPTHTTSGFFCECTRVQLKAEAEHNVAMDTMSCQHCQEFSEQMKTSHLLQDFRSSLISHSI